MSSPSPSSSKYIRNEAGHFVCPDCDKITVKQNTMYYHIKKHHANDLPFECTRCAAHPRFLQKSAFLHHMATLHAESPDVAGEKNPYAGIEYTCPTCEHTAHTKANMIIHYVRAHCRDWIPAYDKKVCCSHCAKGYASSSAYYYHAAACFRETSGAHADALSRIK